LDVFEARLKQGTVLAGDFGLLHAVDDRISVYGYETNTGVKLVVVVDMMGRKEEVKSDDDGLRKKAAGVREAEVKVVRTSLPCNIDTTIEMPRTIHTEKGLVTGLTSPIGL
jgi:hypothetical protein